MKAFRLSIALLLASSMFPADAAEPLRVFIRGGVKTHGPNQHDHPRFLGDWTKLLGERGLKVDGAMEFPTADQLAKTDVIVIYAADGMKIEGEPRSSVLEPRSEPRPVPRRRQGVAQAEGPHLDSRRHQRRRRDGPEDRVR
jgi:hypothetical protein